MLIHLTTKDRDIKLAKQFHYFSLTCKMYLLPENSKYVNAYYTFKCNPCCFPVEEKIQRAVLLIQGVPESQHKGEIIFVL